MRLNFYKKKTSHLFNGLLLFFLNCCRIYRTHCSIKYAQYFFIIYRFPPLGKDLKIIEISTFTEIKKIKEKDELTGDRSIKNVALMVAVPSQFAR